MYLRESGSVLYSLLLTTTELTETISLTTNLPWYKYSYRHHWGTLYLVVDTSSRVAASANLYRVYKLVAVAQLTWGTEQLLSTIQRVYS